MTLVEMKEELASLNRDFDRAHSLWADAYDYGDEKAQEHWVEVGSRISAKMSFLESEIKAEESANEEDLYWESVELDLI